MMTIPSNGGEQEIVMLPVSYLNGWLFSVEVKRVKPEIQARLLSYQRECFDVLANHFMNKTHEPTADFSFFLDPVTEPLTRADYDWRKAILTKACENLDNTPVWQVVLGKDLADA